VGTTVRENRRGNHVCTIQRHSHHWAHKIQDEDIRTLKIKHTQYTENQNDEQYGLHQNKIQGTSRWSRRLNNWLLHHAHVFFVLFVLFRIVAITSCSCLHCVVCIIPYSGYYIMLISSLCCLYIQTTQRRHEHDVIATIRNNTNNTKKTWAWCNNHYTE
jgi:hypothetical protein